MIGNMSFIDAIFCTSFSYLNSLVNSLETAPTPSPTSTGANLTSTSTLTSGLCLPDAVREDDCAGTATSTSDGAGLMSDMSDYQYVFIVAQILHGIGAAALITLGTTLLDESVSHHSAPMYIGIFEASFVLGPALGLVRFQ